VVSDVFNKAKTLFSVCAFLKTVFNPVAGFNRYFDAVLLTIRLSGTVACPGFSGRCHNRCFTDKEIRRKE